MHPLALVLSNAHRLANAIASLQLPCHMAVTVSMASMVAMRTDIATNSPQRATRATIRMDSPLEQGGRAERADTAVS